MDQNSKNKILEELTRAENILIVISQETGFDGLASGLALFLAISKLGKGASVIGQTPTVGYAQRIYGVDQIGKLEGSKIPMVVIDNAVQTLDKVSHFLDKDQLKLIIHPLPGSAGVSREQISIQYTTTQPNLIFAIGFNTGESLEREITHEHKITPGVFIINISNREVKQKFAQIDYIKQDVTSLSEITVGLIQELALPVDEDISYNLYTAIADSTNNFSPAKITAQTFEIASWLVKFGAGRASFAQSETGMPTGAPPFTQASTQGSSNPPPLAPTDLDFTGLAPPLEEVEKLPQSSSPDKLGDWLKPPKIYKGSKSMSGENKG